MKLQLHEITFGRKAPSLGAICAQIEQIASLPVNVLEQKSDAAHQLWAILAFECARDSSVELVEPRESEPVSRRRLILRTLESQEKTLPTLTLLALERLGGQCQDELTAEDRLAYDRALSPAQLGRRLEQAKKRQQRRRRLRLLKLPLLIPVWIVGGFLFLVALPAQLWLRFESPVWLRRLLPKGRPRGENSHPRGPARSD